MKFLVSVLSLTFLVSSLVDCQPSLDSRSNYYNYFFEMLNPVWRHHRARLRPFTGQLGTPTINIRGARSVDDGNKQIKHAEHKLKIERVHIN